MSTTIMEHHRSSLKKKAAVQRDEPVLVPIREARDIDTVSPSRWYVKREGILYAACSGVHSKLSFMLQDDPLFRLGGEDKLHYNLCKFLYDCSSDIKKKVS